MIPSFLAVDEADNEIVDPNNVKETTDIVQTKKKQKKTCWKAGEIH